MRLAVLTALTMLLLAPLAGARSVAHPAGARSASLTNQHHTVIEYLTACSLTDSGVFGPLCLEAIGYAGDGRDTTACIVIINQYFQSDTCQLAGQEAPVQAPRPPPKLLARTGSTSTLPPRCAHRSLPLVPTPLHSQERQPPLGRPG